LRRTLRSNEDSVTSEQNASAGQNQVFASGETLAAKRYALAAFQIAKERGEIDAWRDALAQIAEFMSDPEVRRVLENTRVGQDPKQRLIDAALGDLPALPLNLARLLVRKHRTALAADIALSFSQMIEEERGITHAHARTAVPLSEAEVADLARRLQQQTGREVILDVEVDPSVLGGVIVQIGDRLIDASTRAKLQAMRESLVGAL
jgi:F-type H+-transporting ATPase subunit delta